MNSSASSKPSPTLSAPSPPPSKVSYRLSVFSRILAAALGGYVLMNIVNVAIAFTLPLLINSIGSRSAFLAGIQGGFLVYTLTIIWVFAARTATWAWLGLIALGLPLLLIDCIYYFQSTST